MKAFTGCMKDKIIKNKYKPNECLVLSLNDCKTLFKEYFEEFLTFVDLKLIPEDNQQEMIDTFKTSFDFNCLVFKYNICIKKTDSLFCLHCFFYNYEHTKKGNFQFQAC